MDENKTTKIFAHWDSEPKQRRSNEDKIERDKMEMKAESNPMELLRWYYRLGHLSFAKIRYLAITGRLPLTLATMVPLKCAGCLYAAIIRVPWRIKGKKMKKLKVATKAG